VRGQHAPGVGEGDQLLARTRHARILRTRGTAVNEPRRSRDVS
jgi:hypothetical protein